MGQEFDWVNLRSGQAYAAFHEWAPLHAGGRNGWDEPRDDKTCQKEYHDL